MSGSIKTIDRREAINWIVGGSIFAYLTLITVSNKTPSISLPRILPQSIPRSIGETGNAIPLPWYRVLPRVSINSNPLDRPQIESLPMTNKDCKKYCKSNPGFLIETTKFGLSMPHAFEILKKDFDKTPGKLSAISTDWYTIVPAEPENAFFSASKENIPEDYRQGSGLREAVHAQLTPYGMFIPYGSESSSAWKDLVDVQHLITTDREVKPGNYFVGPDQKIILAENNDVSMTLDNLVLEVAGTKISYDKIKKHAENNLIEYRGKELPSIKLNTLLKIAGVGYQNKAFILHANDYPVSIPPWRQDDITILFDRYYEKYGAPTKLIGGKFLSKAAHVGGFYKIETVPIRA